MLEGKDTFTGAVTYSVVGSVDGQFIKLALGTEDERVAIRRIEKIKTGCAVGPASAMWLELEDALPRRTFEMFAGKVGYAKKVQSVKSTWPNLVELFEVEMDRMIANKTRGAQREDGIMSQSTKDRYMQTIRMFTLFLSERQVDDLAQITKPVIALYKAHRLKQILALKQSRGGGSVALEIAVLHRIFAFGIESELLATNPIKLKYEAKPGKKPVNGARPFTATELTAIRDHAGQDMFTFLVLRWTGLRGSDAVSLRWREIRFDQGVNGEVEKLTQKRSKVAFIPLAPELREALEDVIVKRYGWKNEKLNMPNAAKPEDFVLYNPETNAPFRSRQRLHYRMAALGKRAEVTHVTAHCFRDTFICDMLARHVPIYDVAKMVADTVDTIEKHYAHFIPAARDAAQVKMATGTGIEERARMAKARGRKVVAIRNA